MALKEMSLDKQPEQLTFKTFELASLVAELLSTEAQKKEANEDFNTRIKALKKSIARTSSEIESARPS